jgi:hypothetical protein
VTLDGEMKLLANFESFRLEPGVKLFAGEDKTLVFAQIWAVSRASGFDDFTVDIDA